jgi:hypothetical protein
MLASHHRSAIPSLVFKLLSELQRSISIPTAITSAKEGPRHPAGRKQTVPALASEPIRSAAHSDSHFSLMSECYFFVTVWVRARRAGMASFAVAQSLAGHDYLTVIVTFLASRNRHRPTVRSHHFSRSGSCPPLVSIAGRMPS